MDLKGVEKLAVKRVEKHLNFADRIIDKRIEGDEVIATYVYNGKIQVSSFPFKRRWETKNWH